MGSRCGNLKHVPFREDWPPRENNLGGPYWDRKLNKIGVHAPEYKALEDPRAPAVAAAVDNANPAGDASTETGTAAKYGIFTSLLGLLGAICCCMCGFALWGKSGNRGGSGGRRFAGPRKSRGRTKLLRRNSAKDESPSRA